MLALPHSWIYVASSVVMTLVFARLGHPLSAQTNIVVDHLTPSDLMDQLQLLYPLTLHRTTATSEPGPVSYRLAVGGPETELLLSLGRRPGEIQLGGSVENIRQGTRLIEALELQRSRQGSRVLRQHREHKLIDSPSGNAHIARQNNVRLAQFSEVPTAPPPGEPSADATEKRETTLDPALRQRLRDLGDDVQVEVLPELDIIILRGRDQEIDELAKIIQQIERLAADAQPRIELYELKYAQDQAISELVSDVEDQYTGARQGRVSITPLGKPNALLVIGWGAAVDATLDLIAKLDQPVDPDSQFDVVFLRHAVATTVATTLQEFFSDRQFLGTQLTVTPDRRTNSVIVHAAPRDLQEARQILERLDVPHGSSRSQARVITLSHSLAPDIASVLQELLDSLRGENSDERAAALELLTLDENGRRALMSVPLDGVSVTPNPFNNTLVLSGPAESLEAIIELVELLDTPRDSSQIKVFPIEYGDATNLVRVLQSLLLANGDARVQLPNASGEGSLAPLRFSVDERTNTIIATGPEGDLKIVAALLARLDESDASQRKNVVYHLKNAPAAEVATAINQFLTSKRQIEDVAATASNVFQQIEKEVVVVPEPINNKLILSATPRFFDELNDLIQRLDEAPPQVVIQVLIGEVTLNNAEEFGVELGLQDSVLFDRSLLGDLVTTVNTTQTSTPAGVVTVTEQVVQAATNSPGFNFNNSPLGNSGSTRALTNSNTVGGQGLSSFAVGRINNELGFGGLVLSASSESVSMLIRALQESRRIEVLSRPQVRTLDNQPAYVQVGQRVPRVVSASVTQFGQTNAIDFDDVGLILGVTPRISPDGTVVMEIDAEKSSLATEEGIPISSSADGTIIRAPIVNSTRAQTTVSAASGETIVLAGLITKQDAMIHRRVPHLSDIPFLGNLFRFDSNITRRTELLIVLTPHVIHAPEDSERLKQIEVARMSWCAADVFDIHGDINYRFVEDNQFLDADTELIYPHVDPRGLGTAATAEEVDATDSPAARSTKSDINESLPVPAPRTRSEAP